MAQNFVKPIRENGIVLSKKYIEAREAGKSFDGSRTWDAKPEEFVVTVFSADEEDFSKNDGLQNGTLADYKVSPEVYNQLKFGTWVRVKYTASTYNGEVKIKTESLSIINAEQQQM